MTKGPLAPLAMTLRLTVDGAWVSTLMLLFGQLEVLPDDGVPQVMPVIVTAYGFGLLTYKSTCPGGPPG